MPETPEPVNGGVAFMGVENYQRLLVVTLVVAVFMAAISFLVGNALSQTASAVAAIGLAVSLLCLRGGYVNVSIIGTVCLLWLVASCLALNAKGIRDAAVFIYPVLFLFSSIMLSRLFLWSVVLATVFFLIGIGLAEQYGCLTTAYASVPLGTDYYAVLMIVFVMAVCTDLFISSARRHIDKLDRARVEIEKADRTKTEFLTMMSHELRSPLNPIIGFSNLLEEDLKDDEQRAYLNHIKDSSQRLLELIDTVLEYSDLADGTLRLRLSEITVGELCAELEARAREDAKEKGLGFDLRSVVGDRINGGDCQLRIDRERVVQVMQHLLSNAIRFTDEGSVSVVVECRAAPNTKRGRAHLLCTVSDTGRGIDAVAAVDVFEPFQQFDQDIALRSSAGLGLGLASCRKLAQIMGGDLSCAPLSGQGTRFVFTIPVEIVEAAT